MAKAWIKVPPTASIHIRVLHQTYGWKVCDIRRLKYPHLAERTVYRHAKKTVNDEPNDDCRRLNQGRPRKLDARDVRCIKNNIVKLRTYDDPNFSALKLQQVCNLQQKCSTRTIHRALNSMKIFHLNTRQKGILTAEDRKLRVKFCKKCVKLVGNDLWLNK